MMIRTMRGMAFLVLVALCGGVGALEGMKGTQNKTEIENAYEKDNLASCYNFAKNATLSQLKQHYQIFFTYKKLESGKPYRLFRDALEKDTPADDIMKFLEVMRHGSTPGTLGSFGTLNFNEVPGLIYKTYSADAFYTAFIVEAGKSYGTFNRIINKKKLTSADKLKIINAILGYLTEIKENKKDGSYLFKPINAIDKDGNNSLHCVIKNWKLLGADSIKILKSILEALQEASKELPKTNDVEDSSLYQALACKNKDGDPFLHSLIKNIEIKNKLAIMGSILFKLNDVAPKDIYTLLKQKSSDGDTFFTVLVNSTLKETTMIDILEKMRPYFFKKENEYYPFMLNKAFASDGQSASDPYSFLILQSNNFSANPLLFACLNQNWTLASKLKSYNVPLLDKVPSIRLKNKNLQAVISNDVDWKNLVAAMKALKNPTAEEIQNVWKTNVDDKVQELINKEKQEKLKKTIKVKVPVTKKTKTESKPKGLQKALSLLKAKLLSLATQLKK